VVFIEVAVQLVTVAVVPLNFTVLVPWVAPKFVPVIVTAAATAPDAGDKLVMLGAATTVNEDPLLATEVTVTTTLPVVAPVGTVATIEVALQLVIAVAVVVLNFTVLVPCVEPKLVPVIVTDAPTAPVVGDRLVMLGAANNALDDTRDTKMRIASCHLLLVLMFESPSLFLSRFATKDNNQTQQLIQKALIEWREDM
jgi:hypothetical protein